MNSQKKYKYVTYESQYLKMFSKTTNFINVANTGEYFNYQLREKVFIL